MRSRILKIYICGALFHAAITSLMQDWYGKEYYIEHLNKNWVSPWISVPIAIFYILYSTYVLFNDKGE